MTRIRQPPANLGSLPMHVIRDGELFLSRYGKELDNMGIDEIRIIRDVWPDFAIVMLKYWKGNQVQNVTVQIPKTQDTESTFDALMRELRLLYLGGRLFN